MPRNYESLKLVLYHISNARRTLAMISLAEPDDPKCQRIHDLINKVRFNDLMCIEDELKEILERMYPNV